MKVEYLRGYDPAQFLEVVAMSAEDDAICLFTSKGEKYLATYCDIDKDGHWVAGLPENY